MEVAHGIIYREGMLGGIAVNKEVYPCKTAQICIRLRVRESVFLRKSSYASHYILYSVKNIFLIHSFFAYYNTLLPRKYTDKIRIDN